MKSKKCFKCGIVKPLGEFYKHPQMADGYLNKCKECTKKDNRENRAKKLEYYQEYDRQRANLPKRVKARKEYINKIKKTGIYSPMKKKSTKKYADKYPEKIKANQILNSNLMSEKIRKPSCCSICGKKENLQAHHSDYLKPIQVLWVCDSCHKMIHKELRKLEREKQNEQNSKN